LAVEYIFVWEHRSQKNTQDMIKIAKEIKKVPDAMGAGLLVLGRDPSVPHLMGTNYQMVEKIKKGIGSPKYYGSWNCLS